jgi:hypothetical protein
MSENLASDSGLNNNPPCHYCNKPMYVAIRRQHPDHGAARELLTLACLCGESFELSVAKSGKSLQ